MKQINTAKLKSELSYYLSLVRKGEEVTITAYNHPVAKIIPYYDRKALRIKTPEGKPQELKKINGVKLLKAIDPLAILLADRATR